MELKEAETQQQRMLSLSGSLACDSFSTVKHLVRTPLSSIKTQKHVVCYTFGTAPILSPFLITNQI